MHYVHDLNMSGGTSEEKKGDSVSHQGVTIRSRLPYADGQGGDQINVEKCLVDMEELRWLVANLGKDGVAEESSEANLWGTGVPEQEVEAINGGRRGTALSIFGD